MANADERDSLLSDIQDVLNREIMEDWRRLRSWSGSLADDPGDLILELRYKVIAKHSFSFEFKVQDRSSDRGRFFNVTDRSKGFQWFFNFLMKLKFNPKYQQELSGAIYLLDEPGSYLHSSAQEELLKALKNISQTNTIIYCSHSQHLLDPTVINIAQTKIVSKEKGQIRVIPFGSAGSQNYQGALTPLYNALQLRTGLFNRAIRKAVICEGITDFYFFTMLLRFSEQHRLETLDFIPGAGAGQLREIISMAIAWADDFIVLLDSDEAGKEAATRYQKFFGTHESQKLVLYATPQQSDNVKLEDFLSQDDQERLLTITQSKHLKAAIADLYFRGESDQALMFSALDEQSVENLSLVWNSLSGLAAGD
jgi:predicted ATP-dependent endonuclease of OLD family